MTSRQAELLRFIKAHFAEHGISPSYEEMRVGIGVGSKSRIAELVYALAERGLIVHNKHYQRAIELPLERRSASSMADQIIERARNAAQHRAMQKETFTISDLRPIIMDVLS